MRCFPVVSAQAEVQRRDWHPGLLERGVRTRRTRLGEMHAFPLARERPVRSCASL